MRTTPNAFTIINAQAMTGNITSTPVISLNQSFGYSVQAVWTGTPVGNLKLQCSNDNVNWTDIASTTTAAGGAAGNFEWNVISPMYLYAQCAYVFTSSTGTLTVTAVVKGF